ncbi:MAG: polysaccharide pyruvyl transferase family protein, partial [Rhodospirillaceae bacterium]
MHLDQASHPPRIHVLLYALIPENAACIQIRRRRLRYLRNRLRRLADLAIWRLLGRWRGHYSTFEDATNTNRGDIAILMGVKQQLSKAFGEATLTFSEVAWGELGRAAGNAQEFDLVVIAGGGFLFADSNGRLPSRLADDIRAMDLFSCPIVAASIGMNRLIASGPGTTIGFNGEQRGLIRQFLSRLTAISVRDEPTQRAIRSVDGVMPPIVVDSAFLLSCDDAAGAVAPRNATFLDVGINIAFHGNYTSALNRHFLPLMTRTLRRLQIDHPCRFTYFIHSDAEHGIVAALRSAGITLDVVDGDVQVLLEAYRRMDVHVGQMLHSAILAMSVGIPTLALAYDRKSLGFFELFGLDALCLDATTVGESDLLAAIKALIASRREVTSIIFERRQGLAEVSAAFYSTIAALASPAKTAGVEQSITAISHPYSGEDLAARSRAIVSTVIPAFNAERFITRA